MTSPWKDVALGAAAGAAASFATTLLVLQRYLQRELKRPELVHGPVEERDLAEQHLLQEVKLLLREYWPHPVLEFSGYTSTIWSGFWAVLPTTVSSDNVELLTLQDGGTVSLHWSEAASGCIKERIALVLPGLNNDSRTAFVQSSMRHLQDAGIHAVALNYRGTGGLDLTSRKLGGLDSWHDLREVIDHLKKANPAAQLFAVGFSMGSAMLLKYLGEAGQSTPLKAAVAMAAPVDLPAVTASLHSNLKKRLMGFAMAQGVKMFVLHGVLRSPYGHLVNKRTVFLATTMGEIDEATICPMNGYKNPKEYYDSNDPRTTLSRIAVPTLVVNAEDDPVVSISTVPREEMRQNPRIYLAITRRGGHIGWGSGGLGSASWTDNMAVDFMQACALRSRL